MNSILTSIKKMLDIGAEDTSFDIVITIHINSQFMTLHQIGVGPVNGFSITDESQVWTDFLGTREDLESVKSYVYLKVKLLFDPPTNASLLEAFRQQASEIEWRLNEKVDPPVAEGVVE